VEEGCAYENAREEDLEWGQRLSLSRLVVETRKRMSFAGILLLTM
jgi:hypothetical protein